MTMARGSQVKCSNHNGRHTGRVAHVIVPGQLVAVAWDGYVTAPGQAPSNPDKAWMAELSKAHNLGATPVAELTEA